MLYAYPHRSWNRIHLVHNALLHCPTVTLPLWLPLRSQCHTLPFSTFHHIFHSSAFLLQYHLILLILPPFDTSTPFSDQLLLPPHPSLTSTYGNVWFEKLMNFHNEQLHLLIASNFYDTLMIFTTILQCSGRLKMCRRLCVPNLQEETEGLNARRMIVARTLNLLILSLWYELWYAFK